MHFVPPTAKRGDSEFVSTKHILVSYDLIADCSAEEYVKSVHIYNIEDDTWNTTGKLRTRAESILIPNESESIQNHRFCPKNREKNQFFTLENRFHIDSESHILRNRLSPTPQIKFPDWNVMLLDIVYS